MHRATRQNATQAMYDLQIVCMTRGPVGCLMLSVDVKGYAFEMLVDEETGLRSQFIG